MIARGCCRSGRLGLMLVLLVTACQRPTQLPETAARPLTFGPLPTGVAPDAQELPRWELKPGAPRLVWDRLTDAARPHAILELSLPAGAEQFTVVINDAAGRRVRNLRAMARVAEFGGGARVRVAWNGCNDAGEPVAPGIYQVTGLAGPAPRVRLDYAWYNPGDPPWDGEATSGWGGDHSGPSGIACAPAGSANLWRVVLSWPVVEGPHATIALDKHYRKVWGYKRVAGFDGAKAVALADGQLWLGIKNELVRLESDTGQPRGWDRPAGTLPALDLGGRIESLAVGADLCAVLVGTNQIVFLDKRTGQAPARDGWPASIALPARAESVAHAPDGRWYVATTTGVMAITPSGEITPVTLPGLERPGVLTFDAAGQLYVMDRGADWQIKVFSTQLEPVRTIGRKGGQRLKIPGYLWSVPTGELTYLPDAIHDVTGMAVDEWGQLWVAEGNLHPRRVVVWDAAGQVVRQFIGGTAYGAASCSLHKQDPRRAFSGGVMFEVEPSRLQSDRPLRYLTSGNADPRWVLDVHPPNHFGQGELFRSAAAGQTHEYFISSLAGFPVLYLDRGGDYRPVAAVFHAGQVQVKQAFGKTGTFLWSDFNEDGRPQTNEVQTLVAGRNEPVRDLYGWQYLLQTNLVFYTGSHRIAPVRFTPSGMPVYDVAHATPLVTSGLYLEVGRHLFGTRNAKPFQIGQYLFADLAGNVVATYPLPVMGVHASQNAPVPLPGQTCGELYVCGTADLGSSLGAVVAVTGNMGQVFLFTEDGLYLGALFRDVRTNPPPWPSRYVPGADFTDCSLYGEPFATWFGKQEDGAVRILFGRNAAVVCRVTGLEEIRRLPGQQVAVQPPAADTAPVVAGLATPAELRIARWRSWDATPTHDLPVGRVQLAYDDTHLHVRWQVPDDSPRRNKGQDERAHFKEGDAVELQLGPDRPDPLAVVAGDGRLVLAPVAPAPRAVLYQAVVPGTPAAQRVRFASPIGVTTFDAVTTRPEVGVQFQPQPTGYECVARIPWATLGIRPRPGLRLRGDVGVLFSDAGGQTTVSRVYLFNRTETMTADLHEEARLFPARWGLLVLD